MMDLQSAIQALQQAPGAQPAGEDAVQDRSAFVPNAASLVKAAQASGERALADAPSGSGQGLQRGTDRTTERKKQEQALVYDQRIRPDGDGASYLAFAREVRRDAARQEGEGTAGEGAGEAKITGDGEEGQAATQQEGEGTAEGEGELAGKLADQETDLANYTPDMQRLLRMATAQSKSVTEQYNLLAYTLAHTEVDIAAYTAQEGNAEALMERLKGKDDPKGKSKRERTEKLLTAIRADLKTAKALKGQLEKVLGAMRQKDGQRIDDGYNLAPKSHFVIAHMRAEGKDGGASAAELASNYRDEVLNFRNSSQFFDNFMLRHNAVGFKKYIALILQLLGDDIKSANPSRGTAQLRAIRDGLFFAEMANQIFEGIRDLEHKLDHVLVVRKMEEGTYEPRVLHIAYEPERLQLSVSVGKTDPEFRREIAFAPLVDHFAQMSEIVFDEHVDSIAFYADPNDQDATKLRRAITRRYGLEVRRSQPGQWKVPTPVAVANDD
jgi:hypothetical protein